VVLNLTFLTVYYPLLKFCSIFKFMNDTNEVTYDNRCAMCFAQREYNYSCLNMMCSGICLALIQREKINNIYCLTNKTTNYLPPWSGVLPEKLTGPRPDKKLLALYGTRRFITAFTSAHQQSLSSVSYIQSMPPQTTL
jgi:hypothetical protein